MKIFRQFEEVVRVGKRGEEKTLPVTALNEVADVDDDLAEITALEYSRKKSGIFWIQRVPEKNEEKRYSSFEDIMLGRKTERDEDFFELRYPTFISGYLNGKKFFPREVPKPSVEAEV